MSTRTDGLRRRLATVGEISRALARPTDALAALRAMHTHLARVVDATICFFGLYDAASETVEVIWQVHNGTELPGGHFPLGNGPTSRAIRECRPQLIRRWSEHGPRVQVQYATDRPDLPESSMTVPVTFDGEVIGILALQAYAPEAYDEDDLVMLQSVGDQIGLVIGANRRQPAADSSSKSIDNESILASMSDALVVLDDAARVVRLNPAARRLLCPPNASVIYGRPIDQPQAGHWPLGNESVSRQLRPVADALRRGSAPSDEVPVEFDADRHHDLRCKVSVLLNDGSPSGGVIVLREVLRPGRSAAAS